MEGDATLLCCGHDLIGVEAELEKLIVGTFNYSSDILFRYSEKLIVGTFNYSSDILFRYSSYINGFCVIAVCFSWLNRSEPV